MEYDGPVSISEAAAALTGPWQPWADASVCCVGARWLRAMELSVGDSRTG